VIARQAELPAASYARMVTTVVPTSSGTSADQAEVPAAIPASPEEVLNFTAVTPTLSLAAPVIWIDAEVTETMVPPGDRIWSEGGVESGTGLDGG
jgi:hypothetical protein